MEAVISGLGFGLLHCFAVTPHMRLVRVLPEAVEVMRSYWVYVMASRSRVLYTGVTNDLVRRVYEHKRGLTPSFTRRYRISRLVYFEAFTDIRDAIACEKQIKGWVRLRKISLIERRNPTWEDLAEKWFRHRTSGL
jgi:putative endonuclease